MHEYYRERVTRNLTPKVRKLVKNYVVFFTKNTFSFAEVLFAEHTLSEEIILNEVSLGGSPTIFASLFVVKNAQWRGRKY